MEDLTLTCLGSQDMTPVKNNDCSHYLLGKEILIDCATSPVMNMLNIGECPEKYAISYSRTCMQTIRWDSLRCFGICPQSGKSISAP